MARFNFSSTGDEVVDHFKDQVKGKTILITGASIKGLGAETARSLARGSPSTLILLARSQAKVDPVISEIKKIDEGVEAIFVPVELDKVSTISKAVEQIQSNTSIKKIDIVINNAGIMASPYEKNDAGIESQLAINHIGHFYLTKHLQPLIAAAGKGARIINITSDGYMISPFRFDDYNFSDGATYDPWAGYGQSKTANILFTRHLARKLAFREIWSFAVHPGVIFGTSLLTSFNEDKFGDIEESAKKHTGFTFKIGKPKSIQQGVSTTLVAALDPDIVDCSGALMMDCNIVPIREYAASTDKAEELWKISEQLIGEEWDLEKWKPAE